MSTTKFLFLYRTLPEAPQAGMALGTFQPSPQQMQEMWAQWSAWKAKFKGAILENEENMKPGGGAAVCKAGAVSDGPYIESKEILGGSTQPNCILCHGSKWKVSRLSKPLKMVGPMRVR